MQLNKYLEEIWKVLAIANKAIGDYEPWNMMKNGHEEQAMALVALVTNIMAKISLLLDSVMPHKISQIATSLGFEISYDNYIKLLKQKEVLDNTIITKIDALFPRIEEPLLITADAQKVKEQVEIIEDDNLITIDKFFETSLKIGTIVEAVEVPKSKKLLKLQVDLGEGKNKQIIAGIKEFYSADELIGTQACIVANLKPAKLMGMLSEGMLLAAKDKDGLSLIRPEKSKIIGTKIS